MTDFVHVDLMDKLVYDTFKVGDGSLLEAIAYFQSLLSEVPQDRHASVRFEVEHERGCYGDGDSTYIKVWYERPKTTDELETERIARENNAKEMAARLEARERQQLKALKAKYGE